MKKNNIILIVISIFIFILIFLFMPVSPPIPNINNSEYLCLKNVELICLGLQLRTLPPSPGDNIRPFIQSKSSDQYWWIDAIKSRHNTDNVKLPEKFLYCQLDKNKNLYPSSYISNPKIMLMEIDKLKNRNRTILLVEREGFHYGKRHCMFADFTYKLIDEDEYDKLEKW